MQFLGTCDVCGKTIHTYRGLGQHLRFHQDAAHQDIKARWYAWRSEYKAALRCWKCGKTWVVADPSERHHKRCPECKQLRSSLGKRAYEKTQMVKVPDHRKLMTASGSKAQWDGLSSRHLEWVRGDDLYMRVVLAYEAGDPVNTTLRDQSVTYKMYRAIVEDAFGPEAYKKQAHKRKYTSSSENAKKAHARWAALSPEEKALEAKRRFGGGSVLEKGLARQLEDAGVTGVVLNSWQSLHIQGKWCPREADIKIPVGHGQKIVILCDGQAFHGPGYIFGDRQARIEDDIETADAYFKAGYSVVRYAESEIRTGFALQHLLNWLPNLQSGVRLYRTWHPPVEREVPLGT